MVSEGDTVYEQEASSDVEVNFVVVQPADEFYDEMESAENYHADQEKTGPENLVFLRGDFSEVRKHEQADCDEEDVADVVFCGIRMVEVDNRY